MQCVEACAQRAQQIALIGVERQCDPLARGHDVADQLGFFGPCRLEQHRLGVAFEHGAHVDQVDRLFVHLAFAALDQLFDEIAQPEAFGIDGGHLKSSEFRPI